MDSSQSTTTTGLPVGKPDLTRVSQQPDATHACIRPSTRYVLAPADLHPCCTPSHQLPRAASAHPCGPWSSTCRRRQQTGAVGPTVQSLPAHPSVSYYNYSTVRIQAQTNPTQSQITPPRTAASPAAPAIYNNNSNSTRSPTRSLARLLACGNPRIHQRTQHACRSCRAGNADRFCFYLLYKYCFLLARSHGLPGLHLRPVPVPNNAPRLLPRHPSLAHLQLQNGPRRPFPRPTCLLLAVQRTSITRLAPDRACSTPSPGL